MKAYLIGALRTVLGLQQVVMATGMVGMGKNVNFPLRILTHNIRYAATDLFDNEKPWLERRPLIINELLTQTRFLDGPFEGASFICLQEVLHNQLADILTDINGQPANSTDNGFAEGPIWSHIGIGRDDGKEAGEYSPILYPVHSFKLLHFETKWMSPTPDVPSKGYDAGSIRIVTVGVFEHCRSGDRLVAANTHLDNAGPVSRKNSIPIILDTLDDVRRRWSPDNSSLQFFLAGDFNSFPTQEAYQAMASSGEVVDAYDVVRKERHYGNEITFTGFRPDTDENEDQKGRIDFVWLGPKETVTSQRNKVVTSYRRSRSWEVLGYSVLPNVFDDGVFSSDHRAVAVDTILTP